MSMDGNTVRVGDLDCVLEPLTLPQIAALMDLKANLRADDIDGQIKFARTIVQMSLSPHYPEIDVLLAAVEVTALLAAVTKVLAISDAQFDAITAKVREMGTQTPRPPPPPQRVRRTNRRRSRR